MCAVFSRREIENRRIEQSGQEFLFLNVNSTEWKTEEICYFEMKISQSDRRRDLRKFLHWNEHPIEGLETSEACYDRKLDILEMCKTNLVLLSYAIWHNIMVT